MPRPREAFRGKTLTRWCSSVRSRRSMIFSVASSLASGSTASCSCFFLFWRHGCSAARNSPAYKGKSLRRLRKCRFSYIDTATALSARRHLTAASWDDCVHRIPHNRSAASRIFLSPYNAARIAAYMLCLQGPYTGHPVRRQVEFGGTTLNLVRSTGDQRAEGRL
jgi:hypothetical protein